MLHLKQSYSVTVAGCEFILKSEEGADYIKALADYVTMKMDAIQLATNAVATHSIAILAAVDIADELFRERRNLENERRQAAERVTELLREIDQVLEGQDFGLSTDDRPTRAPDHRSKISD